MKLLAEQADEIEAQSALVVTGHAEVAADRPLAQHRTSRRVEQEQHIDDRHGPVPRAQVADKIVLIRGAGDEFSQPCCWHPRSNEPLATTLPMTRTFGYYGVMPPSTSRAQYRGTCPPCSLTSSLAAPRVVRSNAGTALEAVFIYSLIPYNSHERLPVAKA